jgi:uncharacterized protein (DUF58 family)
MTQSGAEPLRWTATPALSTAVGASAVLLLAAVLLGRQDLLVLGLPLLVGSVLPLARRAHRWPSVALSVGTSSLLEGQSTTLCQRISAPDGLDVVRSRVELRGWLELPDGGSDVCTTVAAGESVELVHRLASTRWGRGSVGGARLSATTAHGLLQASVASTDSLPISTVPLRAGFNATELVPSAAGIVGAHRSRRVGEGVDLAGVRPFAVGDRLRRINWPVSMRTGDLHVTATYSDRDTEVVLVLDTSVDVGRSAGIAGTASNLDIAVRAAASIAEHYLRHGDRVGVLNLGRVGRPIRSRTGRAQLFAIIDLLLDVKAGPVAEVAVSRALARISDHALVIVLSPMLGSEVANGAAGLARAGRSVVLIDTLPADVELTERDSWTELAWRLALLERDNLAGALTVFGVPVVPWLGSGSLDQVLIGLSRTARAVKVRR